MAEESNFVAHIPCENCGSSDANSLFDDGHTYCFACGALTNSGAEAPPSQSPRALGLLETEPLDGLVSRKLTRETLQKFRYSQAKWKGKTVQVAPYYNASNQLVAQHIRTREKSFPWVGEHDDALPFGANLWPKTGKMLVVTEGEIDAMSVAQVQGLKWPVVSIGSGAGPQTKKYIAKHLAYFRGFETVVIMFDNDEPGQKAAKEAAEVIGLAAKIAELPLKDANDMLVAGRVEELLNCMWRAKPYRPDGLVDISSLEDVIFEDEVFGLPFPWPEVTRVTLGMRKGEVLGIGAGSGGGKTDVVTETIKSLAVDQGVGVGVFSLEQSPRETARRLCGKIGDRRFHLPHSDDNPWTKEELTEAWSKLKSSRVMLYDSFGINEWSTIKNMIRFLHHSADIDYFFLDHLTALVAGEEDDKKALDTIMSEMAGLAKELDVFICFVSHLATPEGKSHEEGGKVALKHFRGSRAIGFWAHIILGLERNQQAEDPIERNTLTVRVLKQRNTGDTGELIPLYYDKPTGRLLNQVPGVLAKETSEADEEDDF